MFVFNIKKYKILIKIWNFLHFPSKKCTKMIFIFGERMAKNQMDFSFSNMNRLEIRLPFGSEIDLIAISTH